MRRIVYLLLLVIVVSASATGLNASTDCERWFVAYRREVAHSRQVQRVAAVKRRMKLYAEGKLTRVQPKPKLVPAVARGPRMTRPQALRHFDIACGVLPESAADAPVVSEETPASHRSQRPLNDGIDLLPASFSQLVASNEVPPPPGGGGVPELPSSGGSSPYNPGFGASPTKPGKGSTPVPPSNPGTPTGPGTPGTPSTPDTPSTPENPGTPGTPGTPDNPGTPGTPGTPSTPGNPPTTPVIPEPSSYILVFTGLVGAACAIRRRLKA